MENILTIQGLKKSTLLKIILNHLNFEVPKENSPVLASGCGKTTPSCGS